MGEIRRVGVRVLLGGVVVAVGVFVSIVVLHGGTTIAIVAKAAGIPTGATGVAGFVNGAKALTTPALVMTAAVAPLAMIAGGVIMLFGGRRGMQIVTVVMGVLLFLGSVTAIID